jgi:predicted RNA-binding Zn-ribbon protein involved in translation (DUF1610 family)
MKVHRIWCNVCNEWIAIVTNENATVLFCPLCGKDGVEREIVG